MWRALQRYKELGFELSWGSLGWELLPLAVPSCTQIVAISVFIIKNLFLCQCQELQWYLECHFCISAVPWSPFWGHGTSVCPLLEPFATLEALLELAAARTSWEYPGGIFQEPIQL